MNRTIRYFRIVALLLAGGCLSGCKAEDSTKQRIEAFKQINAELAKSGVAGVATFHWGGTPSVGAKQDFYFATDGDLTVTVQYNAASGRPVGVEP